MKGLEMTFTKPIKILNNLVKRISIIESGYGTPNHLKVDANCLLDQDFDNLKKTKIKRESIVLAANQLLLRIKTLLDKKDIIQRNFYRILEYDRESHPAINSIQSTIIMDGNYEEYIEQILEDKRITPAYKKMLEVIVRNELLYYESALTEIVSQKSRPHKENSQTDSGLMTEKYIHEKYIDKIIDFSSYDGLRLFLYPKKDETIIQSLFRSPNIDSFAEKGYKIRLGLPLKYFVYFFEQLKKKKVIKSRYKAYIERSKSVYCEHSLNPLTSQLMRKELNKSLLPDTNKRLQKKEVTNEKIKKEIDEYIKKYF